MALVESEIMTHDFAWIPKLMTSVLLQACRDLQASALGRIRKDVQKRVLLDGSTKGYTYARTDRNPSPYADIKSWFLSSDRGAFSLRTICSVVGISQSRILERMAPYLCPALSHSREPYRAGEWRNSMKDKKHRKAA